MSFESKVSIVIPVYNGSNYLRDAIDSALVQTYKNIEIIVVNDGSRDGGNTEEIAKSYGDRIRYFPKENGGVASALNFGIREMKGEYFSWLSHDDLYLPEKIQVQMNYVREEHHDVIFYSDFTFVDSNAQFIRRVNIPPIEPKDIRYSLIVGSPLHGCTLLIPRTCFQTIGFFNEQLRAAQDNDLWFRMASKYEFKHIPQALIKSRLHTEQGSRTMGKSYYEESNQVCIKFVTEYFQDNLPPSTIFKVVYGLIFRVKLEAASYALNLGIVKLGKQHLLMRLKILWHTALSKSLLILFRFLRLLMQVKLLRKMRFNLRLLLRRS